MISESGEVTAQIHDDRVYRENQVRPERAMAEKETGNRQSGVIDKISLSAEALALARTGASIAEGSGQGLDKELGREQSGASRLLDVRV